MLARYAATEDLPSDSDILLRDKAQALTDLLLDRRDRMLATAQDDVLECQDDTTRIAVVYGAGHMPAVTHYLLAKYGYRPAKPIGSRSSISDLTTAWWRADTGSGR